MKFLISLFILFVALQSVQSHKDTVVLKVKESSGLSHKKKAEIAGFVSGAATGMAKGVLKKGVTPTKTFIKVPIQEPKYQVKYISVVKPVLVKEEPAPTKIQYYVKEETKSKKKPKKSLFPFLKGYIKGKLIGKTISKTLKH